MTPSEFVEFVADVQARWPDQQPWPDETLQRLMDDLTNFSGDTVQVAVRTFVEAGAKFRPSPSELYAKVALISANQARYLERPDNDPAYCEHRWASFPRESSPAMEKGHPFYRCVICGKEARTTREIHPADDPTTEIHS